MVMVVVSASTDPTAVNAVLNNRRFRDAGEAPPRVLAITADKLLLLLKEEVVEMRSGLMVVPNENARADEVATMNDTASDFLEMNR